MPMNGFMELNQNELEIIDAGGLWGNVLIGTCTVGGGVAGFFGGGIAGAAVGTVALPIVGTVSGAAVGAWAGAGAGALAGAGTGAALATYWGI
ncbi:bacteriocin [Aceticella autotrophica]|uniref:Bacteriocin n=2 Tax=Aceticella autotrophica TaxID=2755338 RepID=A0A975AXP0_9THEO|nr:bacteriocin [Aceticella autotrophica]